MARIELALLAGILRLRDDAYGRKLHRELEMRLERSIATGHIYVSLGRLERKGFVRARSGAPTPVRGGRSKRIYSLTALGEQTLRREWQLQSGLFGGLVSQEVG